MSFEYPNQQPIIDHVPTQPQLEAARQIYAKHNPEDALSVADVSKLLAGMGIQRPALSPAEMTPISAGQPLAIERSVAEPYEPPAHERPVPLKELEALRKQIA